jgi:hypothetical protein
LIEAALQAAKRAGAPALEAYPLDAAKSPSATSTGYVSTFARAGFKIVACHFPPRPIMRHDLMGVPSQPIAARLTFRRRTSRSSAAQRR